MERPVDNFQAAPPRRLKVIHSAVLDGAPSCGEPCRSAFLVPFAAGDGRDRLLGFVDPWVGAPRPAVHLYEQSEGHPRRPFVPIE